MPGARRAVEADVHSSTRAATPVSAPRIERGDVPESTAAHEQAQAREPLRPPPGDQLHAHADTQTHAHVHAQLPARVEALEVLFRHIAATRMADVPICHPGLAVAAVGFEPQPAESAAVGVLLTPWFMNLVWLPMASAPLTAVGASRSRAVGQHSFDFIAHRPDVVASGIRLGATAYNLVARQHDLGHRKFPVPPPHHRRRLAADPDVRRRGNRDLHARQFCDRGSIPNESQRSC